MTRRDAGRTVMIALSSAVFLGCASGAVNGRVSQAGQQTALLNMTWNSGPFGESGKMSAVMRDGERFSGKHQVVKPGMSGSSLEPAWTGDEPGDN